MNPTGVGHGVKTCQPEPVLVIPVRANEHREQFCHFHVTGFVNQAKLMPLCEEKQDDSFNRKILFGGKDFVSSTQIVQKPTPIWQFQTQL